jgi:O-acetylhomoserine (thiol)-lyase
MLTTSGQMATFLSVMNLCKAGDHYVVSAATQPNTKLVFGETVANPALAVLDIETFAAVAHETGLPLIVDKIVDNTFPTPILCQPFSWEADIIVHMPSSS